MNIDLLNETFNHDEDLRLIMPKRKRKKMTNKDIDIQITTKIMGWEFTIVGKDELYSIKSPNHIAKALIDVKDFTPSTNIAHAWQVVQKMRTTHFKWFEMVHRPNGYTCNFSGDPRHTVFAKTAPLAICLASLRAIEDK